MVTEPVADGKAFGVPVSLGEGQFLRHIGTEQIGHPAPLPGARTAPSSDMESTSTILPTARTSMAITGQRHQHSPDPEGRACDGHQTRLTR